MLGAESVTEKKGQLLLDELESAEIQLIRSVQAQSFTDEKLISNLSVFRDDNNIIRVKMQITECIDGRLEKRLQWPLACVIKLIPGKDGLVRTVKLKTQSCTLIRPIQRVFPLEVSGNDLKSLPLQKVQQTDSSVNYPNPDTLKATEQPQVTRCGHPMKKPDKQNLLTLIDVFD
ncbi:DUF5641 domain-containing protein [Trichonephila inaurata madagascariensis]|uniref:DUF5641 domain-containing protein n=1 Tax=Trichonephila inaurata madagascariensis TaxID=2747483 RepID=A0A8X6JAP6_9ARAC|nr:DUF5641 domain-containing protein [Trichonephila inaurata madagascariensis]